MPERNPINLTYTPTGVMQIVTPGSPDWPRLGGMAETGGLGSGAGGTSGQEHCDREAALDGITFTGNEGAVIVSVPVPDWETIGIDDSNWTQWDQKQDLSTMFALTYGHHIDKSYIFLRARVWKEDGLPYWLGWQAKHAFGSPLTCWSETHIFDIERLAPGVDNQFFIEWYRNTMDCDGTYTISIENETTGDTQSWTTKGPVRAMYLEDGKTSGVYNFTATYESGPGMHGPFQEPVDC